jgi:hypothetical protein
MFLLKTGGFEADRTIAGELAVIALNIIGGIGIYITKSDEDQLQSFKLIKNVIDNKVNKHLEEESNSQLDNQIYCKEHGYNRYTFVCQHLNLQEKRGFEESFETYKNMPLDKDDDFQAWCSWCEKERIKTDGWNDESMEFAQIKLVCEDCYFDLKEFNENKNK